MSNEWLEPPAPFTDHIHLRNGYTYYEKDVWELLQEAEGLRREVEILKAQLVDARKVERLKAEEDEKQIEADLERTQQELDAADIACERWRAKYEDARREAERLNNEVDRVKTEKFFVDLDAAKNIAAQAREKALEEALEVAMVRYEQALNEGADNVNAHYESLDAIRALKTKEAT